MKKIATKLDLGPDDIGLDQPTISHYLQEAECGWETEMNTVNIHSDFPGEIKPGPLSAKYNSTGTKIIRYYIDLQHTTLHLHKELTATDLVLLQHKIDTVTSAWDKKLRSAFAREALAANARQAQNLTIDAELRLEALTRILSHTLVVNDAIDWDNLKNHNPPSEPTPFEEPKPIKPNIPQPTRQEPDISFLDRLFGGKNAKIAARNAEFEKAMISWKTRKDNLDRLYDNSIRSWKERRTLHEQRQKREREVFLEQQISENLRIDALQSAYNSGDTEAIVEHTGLVLEASNYYGLFQKSYWIEYNSDVKMLMLDYDLPSPDIMPTLKSVRFVQSTCELKEIHLSTREQKSNFELACYQIALRTLHELFEADEGLYLDKILFNGFVNSIDRSTGRDTRGCLMSILVDRATFLEIDLARVEPKACFKSLKGVSASNLAALAPIAPIMEIKRDDRRFVEGRATIENIDEATNLATMDWEDFEHLVRELFEKEFTARGGEVHVTRSSRDGGVDAVVFDPDPISGGKIVIQAKRYTKTVGVSAVRDLFGTTMSEGATKGILVTTADYGPDAYQFASGKPISLLTGANLLHLLEKHGVRAKIDLKAARDDRQTY